MRIPLLCCVLLLAACENDLVKVNQLRPKEAVDIETAQEVEILYSSEGQVRYRIVASKLIRHDNDKDPYVEFPENVALFMYDDSMRVESQLTANYGISYENERRMIVKDSVVLWNTKGEMLNTEELVWDEREGKISSTKFVKITTPKEIIYGDGFEADEDFSNYRIKKIRGILSIDEDDFAPSSAEATSDSSSPK